MIEKEHIKVDSNPIQLRCANCRTKIRIGKTILPNLNQEKEIDCGCGIQLIIGKDRQKGFETRTRIKFSGLNFETDLELGGV